MDPYKRIWKQLEYAQKDFHMMNPGWACKNLDRADLEYDLQEALRSLEYSNGLLRNLRDLQSKTCLSDVTIKVDGRVFHAHRIVLAAVSPYFEKMFTSGFQESTTKEIELKDIDGQIFEILFNFIYSGKMDLTLDTAIEVFYAAEYLQLVNVESSFSDFFRDAIQDKKLSPEDGLSVLKFAGDQFMYDLYDKCNDYLLKIFPHVIKVECFAEKASFPLIDEGTKEFQSLTSSLSSQSSEEEMFCLVIGWLKHDWEERHIYAADLIRRFRLGLVPKEKVLKLMDDQILEMPGCEKIMDAMTENWRKFEGVEDVMKLPESFLSRKFVRILVAFGGSVPDHELDEEGEADFVQICEKNGNWSTCPQFPFPYEDESELLWPSAVVVDGDIYLGGGCTDHSDNCIGSNRFFKFDSNSYKWTELPKLVTARDSFTLIHHEGFLYAIGGCNGCDNLETIERFNLASKTWDGEYRLSQCINHGRSLGSAVIFDGKIFIYGKTYRQNELRATSTYVYGLITFDLTTHQSRTVLEESWDTLIDYKCLSIVIVVQDGVLYRIGYKDKNPVDPNMWQKYLVPQVNQIEIRKLRNGALKVLVGEEVSPQNTLHIVGNKAMSFNIDEQMYITVAGHTHKTGDLLGDCANGWSKCSNLRRPCVVEYTLDYSKLYGESLARLQQRNV